MCWPTGKALTVGRASLAIVALAADTLACLPASAGAAPSTIAPSVTIQGRPVHSGQGSPRSGTVVVPVGVADPGRLRLRKGPPRAAHWHGRAAVGCGRGALGCGRAGVNAGIGHSPPAGGAAVFGSLNAAGLSAAQGIAAFGPGADVTPPDTAGAIGPEDYVEIVNRPPTNAQTWRSRARR